MPVKIQKKKSKDTTKSKKVSTKLQEQTEVTDIQTLPQTDTQSPSAQQQGNVDLGSFLSQMTQMMGQQNEMMKMMDERMKKLEQEASTKTQAVQGEVVKEPEVVAAINEDNVASYNREFEDGYTEVLNKVWKILYVTSQAPVMRGMQDAAPMMEPVCERRRVGNQTVVDTKYFNSEEEARMYIENLRRKGTILPGAKIISCYI